MGPSDIGNFDEFVLRICEEVKGAWLLAVVVFVLRVVWTTVAVLGSIQCIPLPDAL